MAAVNFDQVVGACMGAFGETVIFQPQNGPQQTINRAVFTENAKVETVKNGEKLVETKTLLGTQDSQFTQAPQVNDLFVLRGVIWRVAKVLPDGHGHTTMHLMFASDAQAAAVQTAPVYD